MLGVLAAVPDLGVQAFDAFVVPGTLGSGDLVFESSVPAGGATQAVRCDRGFLESHIDADGLAFGIGLGFDVYVDAKIPVSAGVFGKASGPEGVGAQAVGVPYLEVMAGKANGAVLEGGCAALEGYPPEGVVAALAVGDTPPEPGPARSFSFAGVVLADFLDGAVANEVEGSAASRTELVEVETGQVPPVFSPVVLVGLIAVVPDGVGFSGHATQEGDVFVPDADAQRFGGGSAHMCIIRAVAVVFNGAKAVSAKALTFLSSPP